MISIRFPGDILQFFFEAVS